MPTNSSRRSFLAQTVVTPGAVEMLGPQNDPLAGLKKPASPAAPPKPSIPNYPRVFRGRQLATIAMPLGGVCAGQLSLGGRGQLRDWEIFNRPDKGNSPNYAFPAIWVQTGKGKPVARVLESRILPPYEGSSGLGAKNAPGLTRIAAASFTGDYPFARVDFIDARLPVKVSLEAFSPFIPHDPDASGFPAALLRYRVTNPAATPVDVSIAFSLENPVTAAAQGGGPRPKEDPRSNEFKREDGIAGLFMSNPSLAANDPMRGTLALAVLDPSGGSLTYLRGWIRRGWWDSPLLFWDDFTEDGRLGPEAQVRGPVASLCLQRAIEGGKSADFSFVIAWHFPNRTPRWCGWRAPKGHENDIIGNWYATRYKDAWDAASQFGRNLASLEKRSRVFTGAMRESTIPAAVKDACLANCSTLASTTCFRTADGEFHGFEGVNDKSGCCHGNCTHVWNYETTTSFLFPSFARSLRKHAFGYSLDDAGAIHFRQSLPDGFERSGFAAADGQMGQILHAYLDYTLSGDIVWLKENWPRIKKALEFSWVENGWDGDKDGVLEGVQHNTYDVEFYGPNPQCGIYYLGALRAGEEMARTVGDNAAASEYRRLFESGSRWIDTNLFNGEYYIQKIRGIPRNKIAPALLSSMGSEETENPQYQVGEGCLADQLMGQYLADIAGLGSLLNPANLRKAAQAIWNNNHRTSLIEHDSVQRIYAINEEPALLICDYGGRARPQIPFPYYAEAWTGIEYTVAATLIARGLAREGVQIYEDARSRHDGEKRNPYDEPECGHHYARAMSAWSGLVALTGFLHNGRDYALSVSPQLPARPFRSFWSNATAWGTFTLSATRLELKVLAGKLNVRTCAMPGAAARGRASLRGQPVEHTLERREKAVAFRFPETLAVGEGDVLALELGA